MEQTQGAVMPKRSRNQELQTEKRILQLSVFADVCFVAAELLFAFASHSQSVLMDAAYDGAEMLMMAAAVCLTPLFYRPISEKYPFGYAQVESVFTAVKSAMMLSVMAGLTVNVIQTMLSGGAHVAYGAVSMFQLLLGLVSLCILGVCMWVPEKWLLPYCRQNGWHGGWMSFTAWVWQRHSLVQRY